MMKVIMKAIKDYVHCENVESGDEEADEHCQDFDDYSATAEEPVQHPMMRMMVSMMVSMKITVPVPVMAMKSPSSISINSSSSIAPWVTGQRWSRKESVVILNIWYVSGLAIKT